MTRLLIEAWFDKNSDKQAVIDKVLAMQTAGALSDVWGAAQLRDRDRKRDSDNRLLVITPDGDDSALKSALWDIAILDGLKKVQASALFDRKLLLQEFVRAKAEKVELTSDDCACPKVQI